MFIQSPSGSIFRSSGSLEQPSEANSQSTLLSINGSAGPSYSPTAFGHYLLPQDARSAQSKHHRGAASQPTSPVFLKSNSSGNWDSVPSVESPAYWVTDFGHQLTLNPSPASSTCSSASSLYGTRQTPSPASSAASSSSSIAWSNNGSRVRSHDRHSPQTTRNVTEDDWSESRRSRRASAPRMVEQLPSSTEESSSGYCILDQDGKKKWRCGCGKTFTRDSDRKRHLEGSTSCPNERASSSKFKCEYCGKSFSRYDSMTRHQNNPSACVPLPTRGVYRRTVETEPRR